MEGLDWTTATFFHLVPHNLPRLAGLMRALRLLGDYPALGLVLLAAVAWLAARRRLRTAAYLAALVVGSAVLAELLKLAVPRERPPDWDHGGGTPLSFPSAGAFVSAVTYGAVALLLAASWRRWPARAAVVLVAAALVLAVGASQLFLGAHFLSDVLAGWAGGLALLLAAWALAPPGADPIILA
jgi:undecaprenyl-diphosphatase